MEFSFWGFGLILGLGGGHFWKRFFRPGLSWACEQIDFFFAG